MTGKFKWISILVILALGLAGCASGDNRDGNAAGSTPSGLMESTAEQPGATTAPQADVDETTIPVSPTEAAAMSVLASSLPGATLLDDAGQSIGSARGMIFEPTSGQVRYLVVEAGEKEGRRAMLVPWRAFQLDTPGGAGQAAALRMTVTNEELAQAPDFTAAEFQGEAALDWDAGAEQYWSSVLPPVAVTGSENDSAADTDSEQAVTGLTSMPVLIGDVENGQEMNFEVKDQEGTTLGAIHDVVITGEGLVTFALMTPDPNQEAALGRAGGQVAVSWKALGWNPDDQTFLLNAPAEALSTAPYLEEGAMPDTSLAGWDAEWSKYWEDTQLRGPEATTAAQTPLPESTSTGQPETSGQDAGSVTGAVQPTRIPVRMAILMDHEVVSNSGEVLGTVSDMILSPSGVVEYLILTTQAGPGADNGNGNKGNNDKGNDNGKGNSGDGNRARGVNQGGRMAPVPWTALNWEPQDGTLTFTEPVTVYNNAPSFDGPETFGLEEDWWNEAAEYWSTYVIIPTAEAAPAEQARLRSSDLLGIEAAGPQGDAFGPAEDLLMDENGVVRYVVLRTEDGAFHAVPWEFFSYDPEAGTLLYTDDPERLTGSPIVQQVEDYDSLDAPHLDELLTYWGQR